MSQSEITKLTPDLAQKLVICKTTEELIAAAKAEGVALTVKQAEEYLEMMTSRNNELSDGQLDQVAGGYFK